MAAVFRAARPEEAAALRDLEKAANLAALGHIFAPERFPFPDDDVLARWVLVLGEPGVTVLVDQDDAGLTCFVAYDAHWLRQLAVRPDRWGTGLAGRAIMACGRVTDLWCLAQNHRARAVYEHLGWQPTDETREAPWPPYPVELRYRRPDQ